MPRALVLDTSVAVKFYVPEELREEALSVLAAAESGALELVAPSTLQPEFFNALWWKHRRGELSREEVRSGWDQLVADRPASLYAPEDLMPRAVEIAFESGAIVYDARSSSPSPKTPERQWSPLMADFSKPWKTRSTPASRIPCPTPTASFQTRNDGRQCTVTGSARGGAERARAAYRICEKSME
ncbi:MAG: type II toxin-antitoxin system VapC family toxin [Rubrobacteraceae bacterium]